MQNCLRVCFRVYVQRERKQLRSTEKGRALIGLVAGPLRSPELTAEWEQQLKEVEEGKRPAGEFYRRIVEFIRDLVPEVAEGPALPPEEVAAARAKQPGRKEKGRKGGDTQPTGLGGWNHLAGFVHNSHTSHPVTPLFADLVMCRNVCRRAIA